jgi:pyridoxamine 5'-phosphate oxidase
VNVDIGPVYGGDGGAPGKRSSSTVHNGSMSDHGKPLREQDVDSDPLRQFAAWFDDAGKAGIRLPEAVAVATASATGAPSLRMVLMKHFDVDGFVFYSNFDSRKGRELIANPHAALLFHWDPLGRQVRIEGPVTRMSMEESAAYVRSRPRGSQLSALASPQSETVPSRESLERTVAELADRYAGQELPLSEHWGGFRLEPATFEFWQQRDDRLHDRLRYSRDGAGGWVLDRLAP